MTSKYSKARSDYSTILGILFGMAMVLAAITFQGDIKRFGDLASVLIVIGGTFAVTIASFSWHEMGDLIKSLKSTVFTKIRNSQKVAEFVLTVAEHGKKKGILGLQEMEEEIEEGSLLEKGIRLLVDGNTIQEVEKVIRQDIESAVERNRRSATMLRRASELAPAMGLIGTLIGLVQMLGALDNPANIGPFMALALLTTLYGALLAYMVLTPLASKIERNSDEELLINKIYLLSIMSIGHQENPRKLERMVNSVLPPAKRVSIYKD
jgi:chemotaxis protein MotA